MPVRIDEIGSADWSPVVGGIGEIVEDLADIEQCLDIILTTIPGTDPHRPLFACDAWKWLDKPLDVAIPNIIIAVVDAIEMWEPRVNVDRVLVALTDSGATITIIWKLAGGANGPLQTTEVTIGKPAA